MAEKYQTSVGGAVSLAAGASKKIAHESDGGDWINVVEAYADASAGLVQADIYVDQESGNRIPIQTLADDGPDSPESDDYPIHLGNTARTRFLTLVKLDNGDRLVFELTNTDSASHTAYVTAGAAGSADIALGNGGT